MFQIAFADSVLAVRDCECGVCKKDLQLVFVCMDICCCDLLRAIACVAKLICECCCGLTCECRACELDLGFLEFANCIVDSCACYFDLRIVCFATSVCNIEWCEVRSGNSER